MQQSLAPSTRRQYSHNWESCKNFITNVLGHELVLPLTQNQIQLYVAYLHERGYKQATILTHLSAVSHQHKLQGIQDPTSTYSTSKILNGVRNSQQYQPDKRRPITQDILIKLITALRHSTNNAYEISLYTSMYTLMYYACLRASEAVLTDSSQHMLQLSNLSCRTSTSFVLTFNSYKHSTGTSVIHVNNTDNTSCPVKAITNYLRQRGSLSGPLFLLAGRPIPRQKFLQVLHQGIKFINEPIELYNIHSFRIGRTTDMAKANVSHTIIQQIGRWRSQAFTKYIRPNITSTNPQP